MDKELNPGQNDINSKTSFETLLHNAENNKTQSDDINDIDGLKNAEENSNTSWKNNVSAKSIATSVVGGKFRTFFTKKGPAGTIMLTLLLGGMGISTLLSPSLLLLQMREVFTDRFNTQLTSLEKRKISFYTNKTTKGSCTGIKISCKYSTFSEKQIENFKKAGIDIEIDADASKTMTGRSKATGFSFEGNKISASEFNNKLKTDSKFRSAINVAYNPKLASNSDSFFKKIANRFGTSKSTRTITGDNDADNLKSLQKETNTKNNNFKKVGVGDIDENGNILTDSDEDLEKIKEINSKLDDLAKDASNLAESGDKLATEVLDGINSGKDINLVKGVTLGALNGVATSLKITDKPDMACAIKESFAALSFAAKTVRSKQLVNFAMFFLTSADQIKAGKADPKTISFLGKILTSTKEHKAATDSPGFLNAFYGNKIKLSTASSQYMVGGGLSGILSNINSLADDVLGSNGKSVCKFLGNPFVSAASLIVGVGLFFVPGVNVAWSMKEIAEAGPSVVFTLAMVALPSMLKDIVAGNLIDKSTYGESAGDAYASGASAMMGAVAQAGGNAPLTPSQAVAFSNDTKIMLAQEAADERLASGQFDITNTNTFLGKLALNLSPYISNLSSLSGIFNSITSIPIKSFASITAPVTYAANNDDYTMCKDEDYRKLNLATDPFCNIVYGISVSDLNSTPAETAELLFKQQQQGIKNEEGEHPNKDLPQINPEDGSPTDKYSQFVWQCIDRDLTKKPFKPATDEELIIKNKSASQSDGAVIYTDEDCLYGKDVTIRNEVYHYKTVGTGKNAVKVKVTDYRTLSISNKYFYIHYMDQRIENMMDNI